MCPTLLPAPAASPQPHWLSLHRSLFMPPLSNAPSAPTPAEAPAAAPVFPKPDPANFTASAPTKEVVDAFLNASWGYDENRVWQVEGILKTPVEGVSKVIAYVGDKSGKTKPVGMQFYVMADGKHIIASDEILSFGEKPFVEFRALLQQKADGPYRGTASKELELVEFAAHRLPELSVAHASRRCGRRGLRCLREQAGRQHSLLQIRRGGI